MLACAPPCVFGAGRLPNPDVGTFSLCFLPISRACWLTRTPCFRAPCEVAGRFILAAKEDPARKRRHQSAMAGSGVDTVDTLVLPCDFGVVRGRFARVNGCSVGLYSRPGECLVCQSTPWTRYMHVETVPNDQNDVRIQQLSPRRRRGIIILKVKPYQPHVKHTSIDNLATNSSQYTLLDMYLIRHC